MNSARPTSPLFVWSEAFRNFWKRRDDWCGTNENVKQGSRVIVVGFSIYLTYVFIIRWVYIRVSLWILLDLSYILLIKDNNVQLISVPVQESFLADYPFRQSHVESPSSIDKKSITTTEYCVYELQYENNLQPESVYKHSVEKFPGTRMRRNLRISKHFSRVISIVDMRM